MSPLAAECEHGADSHGAAAPSMASAPEASRAWLLIEHPGPWPHDAADAEFPAPLFPAELRPVVGQAVELGIRVQLIRRPGSRGAGGTAQAEGTVLAGWTAGPRPWLRRGPASAVPGGLDLAGLAAGEPAAFGAAVPEPVFLVCTHAQRSACCARFGGPLAVALATRYPGQVYQTTHLGGHRFAANLAILPHGLYYGPVGLAEAIAAIGAYGRGTVAAARYRGRAGQPRLTQEAEYETLSRAGSLRVAALG
jgi:hypothetical protein